jgi:TPR repeat protein
MKMHIEEKAFQAMLTAWLMLVAAPDVVTPAPIEDGTAAYQRHDYETALQLLRTPAEQGNAEAQLLPGFMYHDGEGVPQDYAEAALWFRKAAEQGNIAAQGALGGMYLDGLSVRKIPRSRALVAEGG